MTRLAQLYLLTVGTMLMCLGCNATGPRPSRSSELRSDPPATWRWRSADGRREVLADLNGQGLFVRPLTVVGGGAGAQVGPLSALTAAGEPLQLQPARSTQPATGRRRSLELVQVMQGGNQIGTRVLPGDVTVIEVSGGAELGRVTLPVRIESIDLLAMDYGWVMRKPQRFVRNRLMTNFVLAQSASAAVLLGCDQSWRFEIDPAGQLAAVALHRAEVVRFYVGVAPAGSWAELVAAYRKAAHPDWDRPMDPVQQERLRSLVGRMVVDDWSTIPYAEVPQLLERLHFLGAEQLVVVRHNWQHHGYDVKLPDTWPPAERFGGLAGMQVLAEYCRSHGLPFGLHENFDDLYRDAPSFGEWSMAYHPREWHADGRPREYTGWFNQATGQRAVRHTPDSALRAMRRNLAQQEVLRPGTTFLDVTSYCDPDPLEMPDGVYVGVEQALTARRDLYLQAAGLVGGAVLGEGCMEKYLGAVHGANCDLWHVDRWGNKAQPADWEFFPLLDWLAHDRVVFQGVGYPARFGEPEQVKFTAAMYGQPFLSNYAATNILFGHAPLHFVIGAGFAADPVQMASCYWTGVPFHRVVGLARIKSVEFEAGDIHRQHVWYANGARVWVNRSREPWHVQGVTLGAYGYLVQVDGFVQRLTIEQGQPLEVVETPEVLYVDFRGHRRRYKGIEADGAVLVRRTAGAIEIAPLGGNTQPVRVDLVAAGLVTGGRRIKAQRVNLAGERVAVEVSGAIVEVEPQPPVDMHKVAQVYQRPLHKLFVQQR